MENNNQPVNQTKEPKIQQAIVEQIVTLLLGGLSLVAALAWNDAVSSLFNQLFPKAGGLIAKFTYAIFVTAVIVIISVRLRKINQK